jgi:hypothetical protein
MHRLVHAEGELATAQGCAQAGANFTYNTIFSTVGIDEVAASTGPKWAHMFV